MDKTDHVNFNGKKIYFRLAFPHSSNIYPGIIFLHGASNDQSLADYSEIVQGLAKDFIFLIFNFLGCGKSEGEFKDYSLRDRLKQAKFMLDELLQLSNLDKQNITVIGSSMGAHVACRLTEFHPINNLILRAPACYSKDYEEVKMANEYWSPWEKERREWPWKPSFALDSLSKFENNLLIIQHEKDEIIPPRLIGEFYNAAGQAKKREIKVLRGAPHQTSDIPTLNEEFVKMVKDFINQA